MKTKILKGGGGDQAGSMNGCLKKGERAETPLGTMYYLLDVYLSTKFAIVDPKININVVTTVSSWQ